MKLFTKSSLTFTASVLSALTLSACSSGGTVTTLDANPQVPISLPQFLLTEERLNPDNLSPTIMLSTGATVSMQKGNDNQWSGTINVTPGTSFTATVTWNEAFEGQQLPLARRVETLEVATDGSVVTTNSTDYTTDIDTDGDGVSNFDERVNDSDPFTAPANEDATPPANDDAVPPANNDGSSNDSTNDSANPPTSPAQTPETNEPATPSSDTDQTSDSSSDSTSSPGTDEGADTGSSSDDSDSSDQSDDNSGTSTESEAASEDDASDDSQAEQTSEDESESDAPVVVDVIVPRIASSDAPIIDGSNVTMSNRYDLTQEWAAATQTDNSGAELVIENLMIDSDAEDAATDGTPFRRWGAMHDGTYLYVVVVVDDNGDRRRDSGSDLVNDDSLELYIDGDNSKSTSYGSDDFHRILPGKLAGADKQSASSGDIAGPNSSDLDITFATGPGIGPRGIRRSRFEQDVYEIRISLDDAGIDPDEAFGFELQINDDDGGGERNGKWGWKHPAGNGTDVDGTLSNPSLMGTLKLE